MKKTPQIAPANGLVGANAAETVNRAHHVVSFLMIAVPATFDMSTSSDDGDGPFLILEAVNDALEAAEAQLDQKRGAKP